MDKNNDKSKKNKRTIRTYLSTLLSTPVAFFFNCRKTAKSMTFKVSDFHFVSIIYFLKN